MPRLHSCHFYSGKCWPLRSLYPCRCKRSELTFTVLSSTSINSIISVFEEKRQNADKAFEETWPEHRGLLDIWMSSFSCLTSASNRYISVINLLEIPINISFDHIISDFQTRFQAHNAVVMRLCCLIPKM